MYACVNSHVLAHAASADQPRLHHVLQKAASGCTCVHLGRYVAVACSGEFFLLQALFWYHLSWSHLQPVWRAVCQCGLYCAATHVACICLVVSLFLRLRLGSRVPTYILHVQFLVGVFLYSAVCSSALHPITQRLRCYTFSVRL